jgi:predicted RNA binding protein YcfA (HicA-like mRNA interferase family)
MPKRYSSEQTVRALTKLGFFVVSQKGSHLKLKHPDGGLTIVPQGRKVLPPGTKINS